MSALRRELVRLEGSKFYAKGIGCELAKNGKGVLTVYDTSVVTAQMPRSWFGWEVKYTPHSGE